MGRSAKFATEPPVVLWLPDVNDPAYRARLADECRRLAHMTAEEDAMAADFARLAEQTACAAERNRKPA